MSETLEDYILGLLKEGAQTHSIGIMRVDEYNLIVGSTVNPLLPSKQVAFDWRLIAGGPDGRFMKTSE